MTDLKCHYIIQYCDRLPTYIKMAILFVYYNTNNSVL